jgi:parallel beta-helix repeat protein
VLLSETKRICVLTIILISVLGASMLASAITQVGAESNFKRITIEEDGSVTPSDVPIVRSGNVYSLNADIFGQIIIKKDGVTLDGANHALIGYGSEKILEASCGVLLFREREDIVLKNMEVKGFRGNVRFGEGFNNSMYNCDLIDCSLDFSFSLHGVNNTISGNRIIGSKGTGIFVTSSGNVISNNYIANHSEGITFSGSQNNIIKNNTLENNGAPFVFLRSSFEFEDYLQEMDEFNVIDGKPACYWVNKQGGTVPPESGYVFLVNCTRILVQGLSILNQTQKSYTSDSKGLTLVDTADSIITDCNFASGAGISISGSATKNITISHNVFGTKIAVLRSNVIDNLFCRGAELIVDNCTVSRNTIDSSKHGLTIYGGKENKIFCNDIMNCNVGVFIHHSVNNTIFSNNFVNNNQSIFEDPHELVGTMFGPLPAHFESVNTTFDGNYWSGYLGEDSNFDGIGDTPYIIFENYTDVNPLMHPVVIDEKTGNIKEATGISSQDIAWESETAHFVGISVIVIAVGTAVLLYLRNSKKRKNTDTTNEA